jgi:hypothetical protein
VYIGDIYSSPNPDFWPALFADPAVEGHPHDWSMKQISDRIVAASIQ